MFQAQNMSNQLHQCQNMIQQLMNQTQQSSQMYQQMLQQEQQNATRLEELAQREHKAAQMINNVLHGHQIAMQQMQQISSLCKQLEQTAIQFQHTNQTQYQQPAFQGQEFGTSYRSFS